MRNESLTEEMQQLTEEILKEDPAYFLVGIRVKPVNNIRVYIDGDQGIAIDKCTSINRQLYKRIEAAGWFPEGDFSLEVSSPGLDEPLKLYRQYVKNTGRPVEVLLTDGRKVEGRLSGVSPEAIEVEEVRGKHKKMERILHQFPFDQIKSTKLQVVFKTPGTAGA